MRNEFVQKFGEQEALLVEEAAESHAGYIVERGSDLFRWALLVCISWECLKVDEYRDRHGFSTPWVDIEAWLLEQEFSAHDGWLDPVGREMFAYERYGIAALETPQSMMEAMVTVMQQIIRPKTSH